MCVDLPLPPTPLPQLAACAVDEGAIAELSGQVEAAQQLIAVKQRELEQVRLL